MKRSVASFFILISSVGSKKLNHTYAGINPPKVADALLCADRRVLTPVYNWLILVFGEALKTTELSAMLLQQLLQEVASNADHTTVSLTRRTGNDLDQRHPRGTARVRDLAPLQFPLPTVRDAFVCHS